MGSLLLQRVSQLLKLSRTGRGKPEKCLTDGPPICKDPQSVSFLEMRLEPRELLMGNNASEAYL